MVGIRLGKCLLCIRLFPSVVGFCHPSYQGRQGLYLQKQSTVPYSSLQTRPSNLALTPCCSGRSTPAKDQRHNEESTLLSVSQDSYYGVADLFYLEGLSASKTSGKRVGAFTRSRLRLSTLTAVRRGFRFRRQLRGYLLTPYALELQIGLEPILTTIE